jgi:hypothetical protein
MRLVVSVRQLRVISYASLLTCDLLSLVAFESESIRDQVDLEQRFHLFAYLKRYSQSSLVFDWMEPSLDETMFKECDWKEHYPGETEVIPDNMPEPCEKPVS